MDRILWRPCERIELQPASLDRHGDLAQRADLAPRQPGLAQILVRYFEEGCGLEGLHASPHPPPNRIGAGDGKLLADNNAGKALKALWPLAKRRISGQRVHAGEMRAGAGQRRQPLPNIGIAPDSTHFSSRALRRLPPNRSRQI